MQIIRVAAWLISIALVIVLIIIGKAFFIPLFLALLFWYIVNAVNEQFRTLPGSRFRLPNWLTLTMSTTFIVLSLYVVGDLIVQNVESLIIAAPDYQVNLNAQLRRAYGLVGMEQEAPTINMLTQTIRLQQYLTPVLNGVTSAAKNFLIVLLYLIFLIIEQGAFPRKLRALNMTDRQYGRLRRILDHINTAMRTYLGVKTFTSLLTAVLSYVVLEILGLDFALFWAFLIFLFNYIPTIGSVTATLLPALLALLQFEYLTPFFVVIFGVTAVQVVVGNLLEPRLMGDTLNISPLVVILSLILWSMLWGIVGMILCVPITVAIIIVCSQFPSTQAVAILLSKDGQITLPE
ncbi:MAG: AI-2E family transporter [Saprospiraceae bacterium]